MTQIEFLRLLRSYEHRNLWQKGVQMPGDPVPKFGFGLVYEDRDAAVLDFASKRLGRVHWEDGIVLFEPPVAGRRDFQTITNEDLNRWVSFAYAHSLTDSPV